MFWRFFEGVGMFGVDFVVSVLWLMEVLLMVHVCLVDTLLTVNVLLIEILLTM